jgi:hypothetical protein
MSRNIALRNRARREHEGKRGGRSTKTSIVTVDADLALPADAAEQRARHAVREVTGIDVTDRVGAIPLGTFSELVAEIDVSPIGGASKVRVALRTEGRNTVLAVSLLVLAVLSIVGIVIVAMRTRGRPKEQARLQAMAARIATALRG